MFDIGWTEMVVIAVIAIIVIGPKDLPVVLRTVGAWARKARALVREFQGGVDEILRESEVDALRREIDAAKRAATFDQAGETPNPPAEPPRMIGRADTSPGAGETGAANDDQPKT